MSFDPTNFNPSDHGQQVQDIIPPGVYVFWTKNFKRKQKNGKDQILFICEPVLRADGNRFPSRDFQPIFETVTLTAEAAWRLAAISQAVGRTTPFNIMSDRELASVFKFKPFKARVKHDTYNGRTSAKIDAFLPLNAAEEKAVDELLEDRAIEGEVDPGDEPGDSYRGADAPPIDDDDLPF
jgi:hypothetical protein